MPPFQHGQDSQFTNCAFAGILKERDIANSRDGRGRAFGDVFVEWSVKYEGIYTRDIGNAPQSLVSGNQHFEIN
jgi:hypothetical protein